MQDICSLGIERAEAGGTPAAEIEVRLGLYRVTVRFPAAAASVVPPAVFDEAQDIGQGIP